MAPDTVEPIQSPSALVIVEFGGRSVSAVLCDVVAGRHRIVSSAEAWQIPPDQGALNAAGRALRGLEASSGRRLLSDQGAVSPMTHDGVGCDLMVVSGGGPLRALVVLLGKVAPSILDAVEPAVADLIPLGSVEEAIEERRGLVGRIASSLRGDRPDVLLVVGGAELATGQATSALAGTLTTVHTCCPGGLPIVVLAAPPAVRERVVADLRLRMRRALDAIPPVRQTEPEGLAEQLRVIWREKHAAAPIWRALTSGEEIHPLPRLESIGTACQTLSRSKGAPVWAIEVGDADVAVWRATPERFDLARRPIAQLTLGRESGDLDEWPRRPWLAEVDRPSIERQRERSVQAIAEVADGLRDLARAEPRPALVVGRGVGLVHRLPATDAAVALGLGIGLTGPAPVALDRHQILAGAGVLLERYRDAGVDLIRDGLDDLGMLVIGRTVELEGARLQIDAGSKGVKAPSDVHPGEVTALSSLEWTHAEISLNPSRSVDIGYGDGRRGLVSLGECEIGAVLTLTADRGTRRWAKASGAPGRLGGILRRSP
ncbi:MAG: hypothetical protein ACRDIY_24270 [Chloroflexota bacterium]